jgi:pimeloyl-ACP methyl ester carboxylesterase
MSPNAITRIYTYFLGRLIWLPVIGITWVKSVYFLLVAFVAFPSLFSLALNGSQSNLPIVWQYIVVSIFFIILLYSVWLIQREKFLEGFEKTDFQNAYLPLMFNISVGFAGIYCFAAITETLYHNGYLKLNHQPAIALSREAFLNFYYWHFLDLIPQLKIPETFHFNAPFTYSDSITPRLLLAFKIFISFLIIRSVFNWFNWMRKKDYQEGYILVNRDKIYFELAGNGEFMVLIHGMALDLHMWDSQFITFSKYYRVLRYDVRGFGKSSCAADKDQYEHQTDLNHLFEQLSISAAHIVGFGMGARIAIDFVSNYPGKVKSLTLVSPFLNGYFPAYISREQMADISTKWGTKVANFIWLKKNFEGPAEQKTTAKNLHEGSSEEQAIDRKPNFLLRLSGAITSYSSFAKELFTYSPKLIFGVFSYSGRHWVNKAAHLDTVPLSIDHLKKHISVPTIIFYGTKDSEEVKQDALAISENISSGYARIGGIEGAGHYLTLHYTIHSPNKEFDDCLLGSLSFKSEFISNGRVE